MDPYSVYGSRTDPDYGIDESMWRLGLGGGGSSSGGGASPFPGRPGERDCAYYLRTGTCGYGERCRYNHPLDRGTTFQQVVGAGRMVAGEYPERYGQHVCEYYLKTGTCKFGSLCKYHHPTQAGGSVQPVSLNYYGYPLRPGEEECSYFMKTGKCKFGLTCKFHHPQPASASMSSLAPVFYPTVPSPSIATPQQYPELGGWQIRGPSSALPAAYMPSAYGPMLFSPGVLPASGWSSYLAPINEEVSSGAQQSGQHYAQPSQLSPSVPAYSGFYPHVPSSVGPSTSTQKEHNLPQRRGQPECQFYMRTGECKFGATCKYHHPPDWSIPATNCILSPLGLPLRPGDQLCAYYAQHGVCKYGPTCKFDHPIGTLGYNPASSLLDLPVAQYHPFRMSLPTLAPSPFVELRPDFHPSNVSFSTQKPSSEDPPSGSVSPLLSKGRFLPHSTSAASSHSTKGLTGDI